MEESERNERFQQLVDYGLSSSESESDGETKASPVAPVQQHSTSNGEVKLNKRRNDQTEDEQPKKQKTLEMTKGQQQIE